MYMINQNLILTKSKSKMNIMIFKKNLSTKKGFCNLIRFKKVNGEQLNLPKLLVVAPMSGHYATLLRDTVRNLLPLYDVYITDWKNARDVPLIEGSFDLDEFIEYIISYLNLLAPNLNVMAVCQPTVPVLAAVALMSTNNSPNLPRTAILLGGPIDTNQSPTSVNELVTSRGDDWFQQNVISIVPSRFPGAMRLVYPGFMQLAGFMSMNFQRHIESLQKAVDRYADNEKEAAFKIIKFYLEYFSTMDLTAEFYMQTINTVFQEKLLTTGRYKSRGHNVRLQDIQNTSILAIEGEHDDITGVGQTKSVLGLCKNLPDSMKKYFLAEGVGHYGLFNGKKFRNIIIPEIHAFTKAHID
ncbi:polyhydroxyalkanoate depolymerase [Legionella bozemanae]|uniref:polyhydroxyalkanoate depolymerase n=1 Tax=Legionella bozemanae TaxID=447 RepID=UPI00286EC7C1|nr:polyhydroxyalkanoate depolymerase [Legionella bozemanae]